MNDQRGPDGQKVPTGPYAGREDWNWDLLRDLLRDPILYGWRQLRKVRYQTKFKSGKPRRIKNPTPDREYCPALSHMTEAEFEELQRALDELGAAYKAASAGQRHPRFQVPRRKSISPMQHQTCAACESFSHSCGNDVVKCSRALGKGSEACWNHVQVSCERARAALVDISLDRAGRHPLARRVMLDAAWEQICAIRGRSGQSTREVDKEIADLKAQGVRLAEAIAAGGDLPALVLPLPPEEGRRAHAQLPARVLDRLARSQLRLRLTQLADHLLGGVPLAPAPHRESPCPCRGGRLS